MSLKTLSRYANQFSMGLNSGLPLDRLLKTLSRTAPTRQMRAASRQMKESIGAGSTLTQAYEKYNRIFPEFFTRMIQVGESTGHLEQAVASVASYYDRRYAIAREVKRELIPIVGYFGLLIVAIQFVLYIIGDMVTLRTSGDVLAWGLLLVMVVWASYYFSRPVRDGVHSALFYVPLIQRLVRKFSLAKFTEAMGFAWGAGMDVTTAVNLAAESAGNPVFRKRALRARDYIERGDTVSQALQKTGVFPFEAIQIFEVGEETGRLHESMGNVAKLAREQATETLRLTLVLGIRAIYTLGVIYIGFVIIRLYMTVYGGLLGR
ncbi:MAG: type II secretion system F family protein [bacterium]|nr:type II secretion system F family protein [bacterium]